MTLVIDTPGDVIDATINGAVLPGCMVTEIEDGNEYLICAQVRGERIMVRKSDCTLVRKWNEPVKNQVFETMTRVVTSCMGTHMTYRIWREEPEFKLGPDPEMAATVEKLGYGAKPTDVVMALGALPRVSAVEVLDRHHQGGIFYPDWK